MPHPQPSPAKPGQNIEPGCLCLIIAGKWTGHQCTALELKPAGFLFRALPCGGVKELLSPAWAIQIPGRNPGLIEPEKLLRIDGHKPEADELSQVLPLLRRKGASA